MARRRGIYIANNTLSYETKKRNGYRSNHSNDVGKDYLLEKENTMFDPTFGNVNASFMSIENELLILVCINPTLLKDTLASHWL